MTMDFDIAFTPDDDDITDFEIACRKVCNLLDDPGWKWLADKINADHLPWSKIMSLVAQNI